MPPAKCCAGAPRSAPRRRGLDRGDAAGRNGGNCQCRLKFPQKCRLFRLVNPSPFVELQQRFVSDYVNAVMEGSATLVRATRRTAEETLRPLEQQIEQRQQARRSGQV